MCMKLRVPQFVHVIDWIMCAVSRVKQADDPADFFVFA